MWSYVPVPHNNVQVPTVFAAEHTFPPLIKWRISGSAAVLLLSSNTNSRCAARCSGDLSGLMNTCLCCSTLRRFFAFIRICRAIVELVKVTLTALHFPTAPWPTLVASILGFIPSCWNTSLTLSVMSPSVDVSSTPNNMRFLLRSSSSATP